MGMDSVELVLRTEDEFSISISDDEAASAFTVGGLYDLILSKLDTSPGCITSKAFYLTRRALVESLGVPRRSIRPGTKLSPILPDELRRAQWQQIRNQIGLAMPPLRIPADLKQRLYKRAFTISGVIAIAACGFALWLGSWPFPAFVLSAILWVALSMASISLAERLAKQSLATELPTETAGELARVVLSLNCQHFTPSEPNPKLTDEEVWSRLVDIICDQLQIAREEVVPSARFADDLLVD